MLLSARVALLAFACPGPGLGYSPTRLLQGATGSHFVKNPACTTLHNRGTHFTLEIEVGTPTNGFSQQKFDVVADTGSDALVVQSCACSQAAHCDVRNKCFLGGNSSTFIMKGDNIGTPSERLPVVVLSFGSGQIEAIIGSDRVRVGEVSSRMDEGVLLMVDQALRLQGPFEGILGLGLPKKEMPKVKLSQVDRFLQRMKPGGVGGDAEVFQPRGFLESAGIPRFSMCFNDGADGVLRLGGAARPSALGSVGREHWGLDFRGISVGRITQPVAFCHASLMRPGQETPCGAIPDSGTTALMGPPEHIRELFDGLCDAWGPCVRQKMRNLMLPKHELFQELLYNCDSWINEEDGGLDALPPLYFHLKGHDGREQTLQLGGASYVLEMYEDEVSYVTKHLMGVFPVRISEKTGRKKRVCMPAFATQEYTTQKNGPVWILGTPIFYEFQVGYDLYTNPPSLSFEQVPCGTCEEKPSFMLTRNAVDKEGEQTGRAKVRRPRQIHGPLRLPSLDFSRPL